MSFKECWQDATGRWMSDGGFPAQIHGIASLFDETILVIVGVAPRQGGIPLPADAHVVPLPRPAGEDTRRKLSVLARLPFYLAAIARHVRKSDIVHVPVPGDIPFLGMVVAVALGRPLLIRYEGSWYDTSQTTVMNRVTRWCARTLALRGRNVVIAAGVGATPPAPGVAWLFATAITRAERERVQPDLERQARTPLRVAYAGRLSPEKGVRYLIEAVALLRRNWPAGAPVRVRLMGDGSERAALEALTRSLGCDDIVEFLGQCDREELMRQLLESDVCVLPSLSESFCKARLDAMLCGVPVVTTAVGSGAEIVGDAGERGWIVPAADAPALVAALARLLEQPPDWSALRRRCRAYAETRTVESWTESIGHLCASRWNASIANGKLSYEHS